MQYIITAHHPTPHSPGICYKCNKLLQYLIEHVTNVTNVTRFYNTLLSCSIMCSNTDALYQDSQRPILGALPKDALQCPWGLPTSAATLEYKLYQDIKNNQNIQNTKYSNKLTCKYSYKYKYKIQLQIHIQKTVTNTHTKYSYKYTHKIQSLWGPRNFASQIIH